MGPLVRRRQPPGWGEAAAISGGQRGPLGQCTSWLRFPAEFGLRGSGPAPLPGLSSRWGGLSGEDCYPGLEIGLLMMFDPVAAIAHIVISKLGSASVSSLL